MPGSDTSTSDQGRGGFTGHSQSPPLEPTPQTTKRKRSRVVCAGCRQQKLRCDYEETSPSPCTRCSRLWPQQLCIADPSFKRERKRPLPGSANMTQPSLSSHLPPHETTIHTGLDLTPLPPFFVPPSEAVPSRIEELFGGPSQTRGSAGVFTLGTISATQEEAACTFERFFESFHPYCPIFPKRLFPMDIYRDDPFLFWTIFAVATSREAQDTQSLLVSASISHDTLAAELEKLVAKAPLQASFTVSTVKAFLLLAEWPIALSSGKSKHERSFHFISLAAQVGHQLGLHRPHHSNAFRARAPQAFTADSVEGRERTLVWILVHIVAYCSSLDSGLPSPLADDFVVTSTITAITSSLMPSWLSGVPVEILQALQLSRFDSRVATTLGHNRFTDNGLVTDEMLEAVLPTFHDQLEALSQTMPLPSATIKTRLSLSKIRLNVLVLQSPAGQNDLGRHSRAATACKLCLRDIKDIVSRNQKAGNPWPRSITRGVGLAFICFLRLATSEKDHTLELSPDVRTVAALSQGHMDTLVDKRHAQGPLSRVMAIFSSREQNLQADKAMMPPVESAVTSRAGMASWYWEFWLQGERNSLSTTEGLDHSASIPFSFEDGTGNFFESNDDAEFPFSVPSRELEDFFASFDAPTLESLGAT